MYSVIEVPCRFESIPAVHRQEIIRILGPEFWEGGKWKIITYHYFKLVETNYKYSFNIHPRIYTIEIYTISTFLT